MRPGFWGYQAQFRRAAPLWRGPSRAVCHHGAWDSHGIELALGPPGAATATMAGNWKMPLGII
jgi:hypothetical protein